MVQYWLTLLLFSYRDKEIGVIFLCGYIVALVESLLLILLCGTLLAMDTPPTITRIICFCFSSVFMMYNVSALERIRHV